MPNRSKLKARAAFAVAAISAEEDRAITRAARSDPDNPPLTAKDLKRMRPFKELPDAVKQAVKRGRPKSDNPKVLVHIRLDADVVEALKASGPGWQTRVNDTLVKFVRAKKRA